MGKSAIAINAFSKYSIRRKIEIQGEKMKKIFLKNKLKIILIILCIGFIICLRLDSQKIAVVRKWYALAETLPETIVKSSKVNGQFNESEIDILIMEDDDIDITSSQMIDQNIGKTMGDNLSGVERWQELKDTIENSEESNITVYLKPGTWIAESTITIPSRKECYYNSR